MCNNKMLIKSINDDKNMIEFLPCHEPLTVHCIGGGTGRYGAEWPLHFSDWGNGPSTFLTILF